MSNMLNAAYTGKVLDELAGRHPTSLIIEAITPEQLQNYINWFGQIRKFMGQHNIPSLRTATDKAYDDIALLFGGKAGTLKQKLGKMINADKAEQKRLDNVNRFLWGVTTVIGMLPTFIATIDQQLGEKFKDVDDKEAKFKEVIVLASRDIKKATAATTKFEQLIDGGFKSSVAQFGQGGVPYISDPKKIAAELMDLTLESILKIGKDALALKKRWEASLQSMQATAKTLDAVADGRANNDQPQDRKTNTGPGDGTSSDVSPEIIKDMTDQVTKKLAMISKSVSSGQKPSSDDLTLLKQLKTLIDRPAA